MTGPGAAAIRGKSRTEVSISRYCPNGQYFDRRSRLAGWDEAMPHPEVEALKDAGCDLDIPGLKDNKLRSLSAQREIDGNGSSQRPECRSSSGLMSAEVVVAFGFEGFAFEAEFAGYP